MMRAVPFLLVAVLWVFLQPHSMGATFYSYVDEHGVQVYTNIPPIEQVEELQVPDLPVLSVDTTPLPKTLAFDNIIEKYCGDYNLDPQLIRSIIATESGFNHKAVSPKGARGLMQLMPATAQRLGVRNSFDPEENIRGGVKHFRSLMDSFSNNLDLSLAAYNAGENLVRRLGRIPDFKETREYVESVKRKYVRNDAASPPPVEEQTPALIKYVDESGVLHLTNISPTR